MYFFFLLINLISNQKIDHKNIVKNYIKNYTDISFYSSAKKSNFLDYNLDLKNDIIRIFLKDFEESIIFPLSINIITKDNECIPFLPSDDILSNNSIIQKLFHKSEKNISKKRFKTDFSNKYSTYLIKLFEFNMYFRKITVNISKIINLLNKTKKNKKIDVLSTEINKELETIIENFKTYELIYNEIKKYTRIIPSSDFDKSLTLNFQLNKNLLHIISFNSENIDDLIEALESLFVFNLSLIKNNQIIDKMGRLLYKYLRETNYNTQIYKLFFYYLNVNYDQIDHLEIVYYLYLERENKINNIDGIYKEDIKINYNES